MQLNGGAYTTRDANGNVVLAPENKIAFYNVANNDRTHTVKGYAVWQLPAVFRGDANVVKKGVGLVASDWQVSAVFTGGSGAPYGVGFNYQNGAGNTVLTGSPDYGARIKIIGDPGKGCSSDYNRQFSTTAFQGPSINSTGLESGQNYMRGCPDHTWDLALARIIRLGGGRQIQLRAELYNAFNTAIINGRNTTLSLASPSDPITNQAPVYDPITGLLNDGKNLLSTGALSPNRSQPRNAGFGGATSANAMRSVQAQIRFQF